MKKWKLQEARARLGELLKAAGRVGPQEITMRGRSAAVVLSRADYDRLRARRSPFVEFIRRSPLAGAALEFKRNQSVDRSVSV